MYMRMRKRTRSKLSPFKILFGTPPHVGIESPKTSPPSTELCEHDMLKYCVQLSSALSEIRTQVSAALPQPVTGPLHKLQPGDLWWLRTSDGIAGSPGIGKDHSRCS